MAGGLQKYRHLSRSSSHRQALLRNLVTSLFKNETISTTWPKAQEAQRLAEKLITLGKKNTDASKRKALSIFYEPHALIPKLFGPLRERFADRPGGYTRVLRIEPIKEDQAPSAILELVDGPKDMRFAMTARTVSRLRREGKPINDMTAGNIAKVTRFRPDGEKDLEDMVAKFDKLEAQGEHGFDKVYKQRVYHTPKASR
ncbi:ribosomal protein L17, partial [Aureobasidium melanogenum]|uniref:Large ribosomal subunit protein bL17m n=1 Tax=Aureobasidium melanogenum (strain CBS 110374) TaxID=1043003 RepID=A0A074VQ37_AURM1